MFDVEFSFYDSFLFVICFLFNFKTVCALFLCCCLFVFFLVFLLGYWPRFLLFVFFCQICISMLEGGVDYVVICSKQKQTTNNSIFSLSLRRCMSVKRNLIMIVNYCLVIERMSIPKHFRTLLDNSHELLIDIV
jgi:hypothetical protein